MNGFPVSFLVLVVATSIALGAGPGVKPAERAKEKDKRVEEKTPRTTEDLKKEAEREREEADRRRTQPGPVGDAGAAKGGVRTPLNPSESKAKPKHEERGKSETLSELGGRPSRYGGRPEAMPRINDIAMLERRTRERLSPEIADKIVEAQKALLNEIKANPRAVEGFFAREEAFLDSIGKDGKPSDRAARALERWLADHTTGNMDQGKLERMIALLCPSKCGTPGTALSCRRLSRFKLALATLGGALTAVAVEKAYDAFNQTDATDKDSVTVSTGLTEPKTINVADLTKPVPEEEVTIPRKTSGQ
ncbi:MAG: hypothetical protein HY537_02245 [Deltaproteobacteria bacterium]|nr:hypothetical protein [Deltaproteobacteria bacterium]